MRSVHLSRVASDPYAAGEEVELLDVGLPELSGAQLMATLEEAIAQEPMTNVIARLRAIASAAPEITPTPEPELVLEATPLTALASIPAEVPADLPLALTPDMLVKTRPAQPEPRAQTIPVEDLDVNGERIFDDDSFEFI